MFAPPRSDVWTAPRPRTTWQTWWWCVRSTGWAFPGCALANTVFLLTGVAIPVIIGRAIDALTAGNPSSACTWAAALFGAAAVAAIAGAVQFHWLIMVWVRGCLNTIRAVSHHSCAVGADLTRRHSAGAVLSVLNTDSTRIGSLLEVQARSVGVFAALVVMIIATMLYSWRLGLTILLGVPATMGLLALLAKGLHRRQLATREAVGRLTATAADGMAGLRILRGIGAENYLRNRYGQNNSDVAQTGIRLGHLAGVLHGAQQLLPALLLAVLIYVGYAELVAGRLTVGQLVAFCGFITLLMVPFRLLVMLAVITSRGVVSLAHVRDVLATPTRAERHPGQNLIPAAPNPLPDSVLTDAVSGVEIVPHQLTVLVSDDPQTSSAIMHRLAHLQPTPGEVHVAGQLLTDWPIESIRNAICLSDAEPQLTAGSLRRQLDPLSNHTDDDCLAALDIASGQDILGALPDGLADRITERGRSLSGGQRQRVALARAVLRNTPTLLLVEPTSAVDAHTESRIAERLAAARHGKTTVVASTSPIFAHHCDQIIVITGGTVRCGPAETMRHNEHFTAIAHRDLAAESNHAAAGTTNAQLTATPAE